MRWRESFLVISFLWGAFCVAEPISYVDSTNIERNLGDVVPVLQAPIRAGKLVLGTASRLGYEWRLDQTFEEYYGTVPTLSSSGGLPDNFRLPIGLPFGRVSFVSGLSTAEQRGQASVWNAQSFWWMHGALRQQLLMRLFSGEGRWSRTIEAEHVVITPDVFEQKNTPQIFKERVEVSKPQPIAASTWLTFRFKNDDEDGVWYSSPATKRTRQISGTNRGDKFLGTPLSLNDFTVVGEKIQGAKYKLLREFLAYVPFAAAEPLPLVADGECLISREDRPAIGAWSRWNLDSKRFTSAAPWTPTRAVWIKRNLLEVEASVSDPFNAAGRQLIYIDSESMLPVIKASFNRSGDLISTVVAMWGMALSTDLKKSAFLDSMLVIGPKDALAIEATLSASCKTQMEWSGGARFNPLLGR